MSDRPDLLFPFVGARTLRGIAWMRSGNWEKARECLEEVVANPEPEHFYRECFSVLNSCALGDVALRTGNAAEALNQYRRAWRMVKESPRMVGGERLLVLSAAGLASAYAATGDIDRAKELALDASGHIKDVQLASATFECGLAQLHLSLTVAMLRLGDVDAAAGHLEKAQAKGWADLPWLLTDPELLPLHGHPAYTSFVETLRAAPDFDIPLPSSGRASQAADV